MKKSITLIVAVVSVALTGCSSINSFIGKAADANDKALKAAEFAICNGASVGSVKRRFNTPELAELWREICKESQGFTP